MKNQWQKYINYLLVNLFTSGIFPCQRLKLPAMETSSPSPVHRNTAGYLLSGFTSTVLITLPSSSSTCCHTFSITYHRRHHHSNSNSQWQWATSLFDLTSVKPIRWAKVRSKYLLKSKSEAISLSESQVQKCDLSTYLDRSFVEL